MMSLTARPVDKGTADTVLVTNCDMLNHEH